MKKKRFFYLTVSVIAIVIAIVIGCLDINTHVDLTTGKEYSESSMFGIAFSLHRDIDFAKTSPILILISSRKLVWGEHKSTQAGVVYYKIVSARKEESIKMGLNRRTLLQDYVAFIESKQ
jgi:hypothetical protein